MKIKPVFTTVVAAVRVSVLTRWNRFSPLPWVCFRQRVLDAGHVEVFDESFEEGRFNALVCSEHGKRGQRYRLPLSMLGQPHVDCSVHGIPRVDTRGISLPMEVSYY